MEKVVRTIGEDILIVMEYRVESTPLWAARVAERAPLPDLRLNKRLGIILNSLAAAPVASFSEACCGWGPTQATYRFLENPRVSEEAIQEGIFAHTAHLACQQPVILAVQDTTSLNLTHCPVPELGPIDSGKLARGLLLHSTLAVTLDGEVLGPLDLLRWTRTKVGEPKPAEKESTKWLQGIDNARAVLGFAASEQTPRLIHIMDREGDCWDVLQWIVECGDSAIIRCAQDRCIDDPLGRAHQAVRAEPVLVNHTLAIPERPGQPGRLAMLEVRKLDVTLVPDREKYPHGWPMKWTLVEAWEPVPPEGAEALHWLLWTLEPTETIEEVLEVLQKYSKRWRVEDYHLTLKSGCQVENLRLREWDHLQKALVMYAGVATRVLQLRDRARQEPEAPARTLLSAEECTVLVERFGKGKGKGEGLKLGQAALWIGRLGGHLNRKSDGMPGVRTLWKGLRALDLLVQGFQLAHRIIDRSHPRYNLLE